MSSISDESSKENTVMTAQISKKIAEKIYEKLAEAVDEVIKTLLEKNENLKGGDNDLKKLVETRANLKEILIPEGDVKQLNKDFKENGVPCSFAKVGDQTKLIFFEAHTELTTQLIKNHVQTKVKDDREREAPKEKNDSKGKEDSKGKDFPEKEISKSKEIER